ncbi:hypothetical protein BB559_004777 [Furculomyces boomerangus]|uniref:Dicer-like protein 1 n=1 Tax=Furculomyces boomerangus TaxID=61424 RepID=A0A2T9YCV0_9FUNG|nr:hypothetical protein BB559_004777 [Furculomyces boomerangus]
MNYNENNYHYGFQFEDEQNFENKDPHFQSNFFENKNTSEVPYLQLVDGNPILNFLYNSNNESNSKNNLNSNLFNNGDKNQKNKDFNSSFIDDFNLNGLTPRDYQIDLFLKSVNNNSIIVLETGAGKTLIASMIMEYFGKMEDLKLQNQKNIPENNQLENRKITLFLCNTTVIVEQQGYSIISSTRRKVKIYRTRGKHVSFKKNQWKESWESAEVHVMTSQTLLNCLRSGFVSVSDIKLLIFDECHHSRKGSPYNRIMREFYDLSPLESRPRVFGMTASTANASENVDYSIKRIEQSMDSKIYTVNAEDFMGLKSKHVNQVVLEYQLENSKTTNTFKKKCVTSYIFHSVQGWKIIEGVKQDLLYLKNEIGLFAMDALLAALGTYWSILQSKKSLTEISGNNSYRESKTMVNNQISIVKNNNPEEIEASLPPGGSRQLKTLVDDLKKYMESSPNCTKTLESANNYNMYNKTNNKEGIRHFEGNSYYWDHVSDYLTSKVNALLEYLIQFKPKSKNQSPTIETSGEVLTGIIFVNRRTTAIILANIIRSIHEFNFLSCEPFIGISGSRKKTSLQALNIASGTKKNFSQNEMADILNRFKSGNLNLLIATQVAEEGLDISRCNLVIRFDPALTLISYVQARGRARQTYSEYVVMVPKEFENMDTKTVLKLYPDIDKSSHCSLDHYFNLVNMESDLLKRCSESLENEDIGNKDNIGNDLVVGRLSKEILNKALEDNEGKDIVNEMVIDTDAVLPDNAKALLEGVALQIALSSFECDMSRVFFQIPNTGAQLTGQSAPQVLNTYVQSLPRDSHYRSKISYVTETRKPQFYRKVVLFPISSVIRKIYGPWSTDAKVAKMAAGFYATLVLYYYGALNDHLMPLESKKSIYKQSEKGSIILTAYGELQNIIGLKNVVLKYNPSLKHINHTNPPAPYTNNKNTTNSNGSSTQTPFPNPQPHNTNQFTNSTTQLKRKRSGLDSPADHQKKIQKLMYENTNSIEFESFSPKHWVFPKIIKKNKSTNEPSTKPNDLVEAYAYSVDLNHPISNSYSGKEKTAEIVYESSNKEPELQKNSLGFQLIVFFTKPLPENLILPLYIDSSSFSPTYYKFDKLCSKYYENFEKEKPAIKKNIGLEKTRNNRIYLNWNKWESAVSYTSTIFSILSQNELRLDPSKASYAFAKPSDGFSKVLESYYFKRRSLLVEEISVLMPDPTLAIEKFHEITGKLPYLTDKDISWDSMDLINKKPVRLSIFPIHEWSHIFENHVLISDTDRYAVFKPDSIIKGTSIDNTISDIIDTQIQNLKEGQNNETFIQNNQETKAEISDRLKSLENLKSNIGAKAGKIRFLDYMFHYNLLHPSFPYHLFVDHPLIRIKKINLPISYLTSGAHLMNFENSGFYNADFRKPFEAPDFVPISQLSVFNDLAEENDADVNPDIFYDLENKSKFQSFDFKYLQLTEHEKEKIEGKLYSDVMIQLKVQIGVSGMLQVLPWSFDQIKKLSVLPSLMHRLNSDLIITDMVHSLNIPISPNSVKFTAKTTKNTGSSKQTKYKKSISLPSLNDYSLTGFQKKFFNTENKEAFETLFNNLLGFTDESESKNQSGINHFKANGIKNNSEMISSIKKDIRLEKDYSMLNTIPSWLIRSALTLQAASEDVNYQRLEILGDSVVKLIMATQLFAGLAPPISHEGILSSYTGFLVSNAFLAKISRATGICYATHNNRLERKDWIPVGPGWWKSLYPLPRTISHDSQPWSYKRGCPSLPDTKNSNFAAQYNNYSCRCTSNPVQEKRNNIEQTTRTNGLSSDNTTQVSDGQSGNISLSSPTGSNSKSDSINYTKQSGINKNKSELTKEENDYTDDEDLTQKEQEPEGISLKELSLFANLANIKKVNDRPKNHLISSHNGPEKGEGENTETKKPQSSTFENGNEYPNNNQKNVNGIEKFNIGQNVSNFNSQDTFVAQETNINNDSLANEDKEVNNKPNEYKSIVNRANAVSIEDLKRAVLIKPPMPLYAFFPTKRPPEYKINKVPLPLHKQHFLVKPPRHKTIKLQMKMQADIIESVLGAAYKFGGIECSFLTSKSLGLVNSNWNSWGDMTISYKSLIDNKKNLGDNFDITNNEFFGSKNLNSNTSDFRKKAEPIGKTVSQLELALEYKFKNPFLALEAITHSSVTNSMNCSYQRLEFLGDAVIAMLVTEYYYDRIISDSLLSQHIITLVKHIAVSNNFLGLLAHRHKLTRFLLYDNETLKNEIEFYEKTIDETIYSWKKGVKIEIPKSKIQDDDENDKDSDPEQDVYKNDFILPSEDKHIFGSKNNDLNVFKLNEPKASNTKNKYSKSFPEWTNFPSEIWQLTDPPKAMGDLLESLIGAIYVDSGFSLDSARKAFERLAIPAIERFAMRKLIEKYNKSYTEFLKQVLGVEGRYDGERLRKYIEKRDLLIPSLDDLKRIGSYGHVCFLISHKNTLLGFGYAKTPKRARFRASEHAIKNWDLSPTFSTQKLLESCCKCSSKHNF